jgi:hypothetical protein
MTLKQTPEEHGQQLCAGSSQHNLSFILRAAPLTTVGE